MRRVGKERTAIRIGGDDPLPRVATTRDVTRLLPAWVVARHLLIVQGRQSLLTPSAGISRWRTSGSRPHSTLMLWAYWMTPASVGSRCRTPPALG